LLTAIGVGALTCVVTWLGVGAVRRVTERRRILDLPGARSLHDRPVPRGGGLAIATVCLGALAILPLAGLSPSPLLAGWMLLGGAVVAAVSWADDLRSLPVPARLAAHVAAAVCVLVATGAPLVVEVPLFGELRPAWLGPPLVVLWVVGLTNAYNFMDGIDGIAAGQAVVAGLGWLLLPSGDLAVRALGLVLAAACAGFLPHNWQPARLFMGDVGSAFIGYLLAGLTVVASRHNPRFAVAGVLLVWPFVFDTAYTMLRRLRRGENLLTAHRAHIYQRLVIGGWQHRSVAILYTALACLGLGFGVLWLRGGAIAAVSVAVGVPLAAVGLWALVVWNERQGGRAAARGVNSPAQR
jgi:UDP-N-acetylmuramyl pentapeptide phosphotransferase/UDP-N-acetylglucosamine-1-phosphate transferase